MTLRRIKQAWQVLTGKAYAAPYSVLDTYPQDDWQVEREIVEGYRYTIGTIGDAPESSMTLGEFKDLAVDKKYKGGKTVGELRKDRKQLEREVKKHKGVYRIL